MHGDYILAWQHHFPCYRRISSARRRKIATLMRGAIPGFAEAQQDTIRKPEARFNLHFQTTYIYQYSARFKTPYSGYNSLSGDEERDNSVTMTFFGGARLWK